MSSISVIIPTWNRADTLKAAVNSVLNQTYPVMEVLICDDGSTDNSQAIILSITDKRVRWIDCGRNGRPAIPRNMGVKESKGEWIAFLDSDDVWLPQKVAKQMQALDEYRECLAVSCNAMKVDALQKNQTVFHSVDRLKFRFKDLAETNYIICSSALMHRSLFQLTGGFPEKEEFKAIEDYSLWLKVAAFTEWIYLKEPLLNYHDNPSQSIRANDLNVWEQRKIIFSDMLNWLNTQKANVPAMHKQMARKELLLAEYYTGKTFGKRLIYRLRHILNV